MSGREFYHLKFCGGGGSIKKTTKQSIMSREAGVWPGENGVSENSRQGTQKAWLTPLGADEGLSKLRQKMPLRLVTGTHSMADLGWIVGISKDDSGNCKYVTCTPRRKVLLFTKAHLTRCKEMHASFKWVFWKFKRCKSWQTKMCLTFVTNNSILWRQVL